MGEIYDKSGKKVGSLQGSEIYIEDKKVGQIKGDELLDLNGRVIGIVKDGKVFDPSGSSVLDLQGKSVWDVATGQEISSSTSEESLPAAAYYSLLKKNNE